LLKIFLKWKIPGWEKKMLEADRKSFYKEEAVSMGPITRISKAYDGGRWAETIEESYKLLTRFHDYTAAYYYLGMALAKVGESALALQNMERAIESQKSTMDTYDDQYAFDYIQLCKDLNKMDQCKAFFKKLADRDAKGKRFLERLTYMGKL
jgi:tetratricopeptide (TPR) repeat protein